jgi:hypothetical protein
MAMVLPQGAARKVCGSWQGTAAALCEVQPLCGSLRAPAAAAAAVGPLHAAPAAAAAGAAVVVASSSIARDVPEGSSTSSDNNVTVVTFTLSL